MNYKYNDNCLTVNGKSIDFPYDIGDVQEAQGKLIVLLDIPGGVNFINNIYAVNSKTELIWQVQDLREVYPQNQYPQLMLLPYIYMHIEEGTVRGVDFYARNYYIDLDSGKIKKMVVYK